MTLKIKILKNKIYKLAVNKFFKRKNKEKMSKIKNRELKVQFKLNF